MEQRDRDQRPAKQQHRFADGSRTGVHDQPDDKPETQQRSNNEDVSDRVGP